MPHVLASFRIRSLIAACCVVSAGACALSASTPSFIPAFPGAEGFGARASGGRGGRVIAVTNLDNSGPGSLRAAVEASGPRTVVFRVSGNIALLSNITVRNGDLTIAGQTAPGDGICLKGRGLTISGARNVIIRYLRVRPGDTSGAELDSIECRSGEDIIIDHCSASWSVDECVSIYDNARNITVQWCLISESLYASVHSKGNHGFGGIWGGRNASWHHNLVAHHSSRTPRITGGTVVDQLIDMRNNVVYNWGYNSCYGGDGDVLVNMINNVFKPGPATSTNVRTRLANPSAGKALHNWWIAGNLAVGSNAVTGDNWLGVHPATGVRSADVRAAAPFRVAHVNTEPASDTFERVLQQAGATLPRRDSLDTRIVEEARTGTARFGETYAGGGKGIIDSQRAVGGWPDLQSTAAPADTDGDGMPDAWEVRSGFDPNQPTDGPQDKDRDGYTNLEEYLNGTDPTVSDSRVMNLSTRASGGTGDAMLISGFVIRGEGSKRLLIRTVGPELAAFGLASPMPDPAMVLKQWVGDSYQDIAANDDWGRGANAAVLASTATAVGAFALKPGSASAALLADLPAGSYTVVGREATGLAGVGIIELYDTDSGAPGARLINLSTRGFVGVGDGLMIPGFIISEREPKTVLVRAVGPRLAGEPYNVAGTLADPRVALYRRMFGSAVDELLLSNDNWGDNGNAALITQVAGQVGAFALDAGSADAAFVAILPPGLYTVHASGAGATSGVALVEVYVVE